MNGSFVISLDFELHWGVFDLKTVDQYRENLANVQKVIPRLLTMSEQYGVKITFATVGFLFAKDKEMLKAFAPTEQPNYLDEGLKAYPLFDNIGIDETEDPFHYAHSLIKTIQEDGRHEIGSHTHCHYYCEEEGQTLQTFEADTKASVAIANTLGIPMQSIVFPRNQVNESYLKVCREQGITSYRGTEAHNIYEPRAFTSDTLSNRLTRLLDSYFNITGDHIYDKTQLQQVHQVVNIPSSRFLRPFMSKLSFLEPLKIRRITKTMQKAAQRGKLFHLWWHPHNFGSDMEQNFKNLEVIFKKYKELNDKYGFKSETMTEISNSIVRDIHH